MKVLLKIWCYNFHGGLLRLEEIIMKISSPSFIFQSEITKDFIYTFFPQFPILIIQPVLLTDKYFTVQYFEGIFI